MSTDSHRYGLDVDRHQAIADSNVSLPVPSIDFDSAASSQRFNMLDHSTPSRFWLSAQTNTVFQYHPTIYSPYSGPNSFKNYREGKIFNVSSVIAGYRFLPGLEAFYCLQRTDGSAPSAGLGMAGYPNFDVQKNPSLSGKFYTARIGLHAVIPLSGEYMDADRSPCNFSTRLPVRRLEIRVGKFSTLDYFNVNSLGGDNGHQFMNFASNADASYDFAADTRGYTWGGMIEYQSRHWAARFLEAALPTVANGLTLQWNSKVHSENYEIEHRHTIYGRPGVLKSLGWVNHAHMGDYWQSIVSWETGQTATPDITSSEKKGAMKYGFSLSAEQEIVPGLSLYTRLGWSEGLRETFCYTECDDAAVLGGIVQGRLWRRPDDKLGLALMSNGLSKAHREYLSLGGVGMTLGDGALNYRRENILEFFYTCHLWKGVYAGPDIQFVNNPGYNKDRGPVLLVGCRLHTDF